MSKIVAAVQSTIWKLIYGLQYKVVLAKQKVHLYRVGYKTEFRSQHKIQLDTNLKNLANK